MIRSAREWYDLCYQSRSLKTDVSTESLRNFSNVSQKEREKEEDNEDSSNFVPSSL